MIDPEFTSLPLAFSILTRGCMPMGHPSITVLMAGSARSGTSATAALVDAMGVRMDDSFDGHFERLYFKNNLAAGYYQMVAKDVELLNGYYCNESWGVQLWLDLWHVNYMIRLCRNPVVILTVRDMAAVVARWNSVDFGGKNQEQRLTLYLEQLSKLVGIFSSVQCPAVLVSFEKLRKDPAQVYDELADFLGMVDGNKKIAVARINYGSGYLVQTPPENYDYDQLRTPL